MRQVVAPADDGHGDACVVEPGELYLRVGGEARRCEGARSSRHRRTRRDVPRRVTERCRSLSVRRGESPEVTTQSSSAFEGAPAPSTSRAATPFLPSGSGRREQLERELPVAVESVHGLVAGREAVDEERGTPAAAGVRPQDRAGGRHGRPRSSRRLPRRRHGPRRRRGRRAPRRAASPRDPSPSGAPRFAVVGQWTRRSDSPCTYSRTLWRSKPLGRRMRSRRPSCTREPVSEKSVSSSTRRG